MMIRQSVLTVVTMIVAAASPMFAQPEFIGTWKITGTDESHGQWRSTAEGKAYMIRFELIETLSSQFKVRLLWALPEGGMPYRQETMMCQYFGGMYQCYDRVIGVTKTTSTRIDPVCAGMGNASSRCRVEETVRTAPITNLEHDIRFDRNSNIIFRHQIRKSGNAVSYKGYTGTLVGEKKN